MNYFKSEHDNITSRRKHYQKQRTIVKPSRQAGLTIEQIRAKMVKPSRQMIERTLFFEDF